MKKVLLVSMLCFFVFVNGYSQTKKESIKVLISAMQTDSLLSKVFNNMTSLSGDQMKANLTDPDAKAKFESMMKSIKQQLLVLMEKMINEDMVDLYDKYFTQSEINDYITFYKSPSGQKFLKATPDLQKDMMNILMQKYMPDMQKTIKEAVDKQK